jgi:TPP-dependent pyruvate/acetoin dehydrogenase alpha subunit
MEQKILTEAKVGQIDKEADEWVADADKFATEGSVPGPEILENALYVE